MKLGISDKGMKRIANDGFTIIPGIDTFKLPKKASSDMIDSNDRFWVVIDPYHSDEGIKDIMWESDLSDLGNWFIKVSSHTPDNASEMGMTLYFNEDLAKQDAMDRLDQYSE